MPNIITCDECIGRSTKGPTYKGAQAKGRSVVIRQHTFDYDVDIYLSFSGRAPVYEKVLVRSLAEKSGKKCVRECVPRRTLYASELALMQLDFSDGKALNYYFKVIPRNCRP